MLQSEFVSNGFCFIKPENYISDENSPSLHDLKKCFDLELEDDGNAFRRRAYLKLEYTKENNQVTIPANQAYFQTAESNQTDGGKARYFKVMPKKILNIPIVKNLLAKNLQMLMRYESLRAEKQFTIGLHFIRYQATENLASYSSPAWLHKDDEPLVFIHLVHLSKAALGGDNLIAKSDTQEITHVVRLENEMDTLVLNKNVYHAVTPLGSKKGLVTRDVILFTIEPQYTQLNGLKDVRA